MIGSILSMFDFFSENNSGSSSSHVPDVKLVEPASTLIFSLERPAKEAPSPKNTYRKLHRQLQALSYSEEEVRRLLVPLEQPNSFDTKDAWFNDNLVNDYFEHLANQHPNLKVISSLMTQCKPSLPDRLCTWPKYSEWKEGLSQSPLVFWPIHQADHWHLIVIENTLNNANVSLLDGFNTKDKEILQMYGIDLVLSTGSESVNVISGDFISVAQQRNAYDCGSVICFYAKLIAEFYATNRRLPDLGILNTSAVDYTSFRKEIADALVEYKAGPDFIQSGVRSKSRL